MPRHSIAPTEIAPVRIYGPSDQIHEGTVHFQRRSDREAFWWGAKRALKIIAIIFGCLLPFAFLEPFLFMIWGSVVLGIMLLGVGPYLHFKYWGETTSFSSVEANCPHCQQEGSLSPYISTRLQQRFTVLCPACGQTSTVLID